MVELGADLQLRNKEIMKFVELEGNVSSWREELAGEVKRVAVRVSALGMAGRCLEGEWGVGMDEVADWLKRSVEILSEKEEEDRNVSNDGAKRGDHLIDGTHIDNTHIDNTHIDNHAIDNTHIDNHLIDGTHIDNTHIDNTHIDNTHNNHITDTSHHQSHNDETSPSPPLLSLVTTTSSHLHTLDETLISLPPFSNLDSLSSLVNSIPAGIQSLAQFESFLEILTAAGKCKDVTQRITAGMERLTEQVKKLRKEETALRRWSNVETEIPEEWGHPDAMKLPRERVEIMDRALQRGIRLLSEWNCGSFNEQMEEYLGNMRKIVEETAEMLHERGKMCGMREGNSWREK